VPATGRTVFFPKEATVKSLVKRFVKGEEGVSLLEYGLLAALIAVACIVVLGLIGEHMNAKFTTVDTELQ
jgi:pilus assembly protein Flp/PilA